MTFLARVSVLTVLLSTASIAAGAAPSDFAGARAQAQEQAATPEGSAYEATKFMPHYREGHAKSLQACFKDTPDPDRRSFSFVVVLDHSGKPTGFFLDRETNIALCLKPAVMSDTFPPPPFSAFYEAVDMAFTK